MCNALPICRVCLNTALEYIDFETPFDDNCTYLDCFRKCTRMDFENTPPQSLCDVCGLELKIAYSFLQKAEEADRILRRKAVIKNELNEWQGETTDSSIVEDDEQTQEFIVTCEEPEQTAEVDDEYIEELVYACNYCSQTFLSQFVLNLHMTEMHSEAQSPSAQSECSNDLDAPISTDTQEVNGSSKEISTKEEQGVNGSSTEMLSTKEEDQESVLCFGDTMEENTEMEMLESNDEEFEDTMAELLEKEDKEIMAQMTTYVEEDEKEAHQEFAKCQKSISVTEFKADATTDQNSEIISLPAKSYSYTCSACSNSYDTHATLMRHQYKVHSPLAATTTTCKICHEKVAGKADAMRAHLQQLHSAIVQCSKCIYRGKESRLSEHERRVHAEQRDFLCNVCSKTFTSSGLLNAHLKHHERKKSNAKSDACEVCGKQFSTQHYLRQHMDVHSDERELHKCTQCDKIYFSKTALENHMRVHNGNKVVECPWCGKMFARQYELTVHKRFHTLDYPFACEVCGKKFAIKGHLRTHMWRHQGLKLQCDECGKLFTSTKALSEHSYSHTEMPFPCSYCAKGYPSKQKYKIHLKTIHLIDLTEEELQKVTKAVPKPLLRKKLTLVQADSVIQEVEMVSREDDAGGAASEILVELC